jgi:hypothetical protein
VTLAWNDLKTSERRAAYDRQNRSSATKITRIKSRKSSRRTRRAASRGHAHGQSRRFANEKQGFLQRLFAWVGAWA